MDCLGIFLLKFTLNYKLYYVNVYYFWPDLVDHQNSQLWNYQSQIPMYKLICQLRHWIHLK